MNIFEIFCHGDTSLNETNMSSVLGFLLNENAPHGYRRSFLAQFCSPFIHDLRRIGVVNLQETSSDFRSILNALSHFEKITVDLEELVERPPGNDSSNSTRKIDIVLRFYEQKRRQDGLSVEVLRFVIAIENKIRKNSAGDPRQLKDEYDFLRATVTSDENGTNVPIVMVFLTSENIADIAHTGTTDEWANLDGLKEQPQPACNDFKVNIAWQLSKSNKSESLAPSLSAMATTLLCLERNAEINPSSSHSELLLRSMIRFISNDFDREKPIYQYERADNAPNILSDAIEWLQFNGMNRAPAMKVFISDLIQHLDDRYSEHFNRYQNYLTGHKWLGSRVTYFADERNNPADLSDIEMPRQLVKVWRKIPTTNSVLTIQFYSTQTSNFNLIFRPDIIPRLEPLITFSDIASNSYRLQIPLSIGLERAKPMLECAILESIAAAGCA